MKCREARPLLVAFQDRELSPAEDLRVREHLDTCQECRHLEERLAEVTPRPFVKSDPAAEEALWKRLDAALDAERAKGAALRPETAWDRARGWLAEDTRMPTAAVIAYAALLLLAVGWGTTNWWEARHLQATLERGVRVTAASGEIAPDQVKPAAYHPESEPAGP